MGKGDFGDKREVAGDSLTAAKVEAGEADLDVVRAAKQARRNPAAPRHLVDPTHQLDCCLLSPYHTPLLLRPSKTT